MHYTKNNRESFTVLREIVADAHRRLCMFKITRPTWTLWNETTLVY